MDSPYFPRVLKNIANNGPLSDILNFHHFYLFLHPEFLYVFFSRVFFLGGGLFFKLFPCLFPFPSSLSSFQYSSSCRHSLFPKFFIHLPFPSLSFNYIYLNLSFSLSLSEFFFLVNSPSFSTNVFILQSKYIQLRDNGQTRLKVPILIKSPRSSNDEPGQ